MAGLPLGLLERLHRLGGLIVHAFGGWERFPFYNVERGGNWYDAGFLLGAGFPFLGIFGGNKSSSRRRG